MSYDTEHVRNAGETPLPITDISTLTAVITNAHLAQVYTAISQDVATTGPEIQDNSEKSKRAG